MVAGEDKYLETKGIGLFERVPFLESSFDDDGIPHIEKLHVFPPPRVTKTHLPCRFIQRWVDEDQINTIVIIRNPKDTLVSLFHFMLSMDGKSRSSLHNMLAASA